MILSANLRASAINSSAGCTWSWGIPLPKLSALPSWPPPFWDQLLCPSSFLQPPFFKLRFLFLKLYNMIAIFVPNA